MSLTNNCPDCGSLIGKSAYKCRCGWKKADVSVPAIRPNCAVFDCKQVAMSGLDRCQWHYERQHQDEAREYAERHGLKTAEDHIQHCRRLLSTLGTRWTRDKSIEHWLKVARSAVPIAREAAAEALAKLHYHEREPGADEEEWANAAT